MSGGEEGCRVTGVADSLVGFLSYHGTWCFLDTVECYMGRLAGVIKFVLRLRGSFGRQCNGGKVEDGTLENVKWGIFSFCGLGFDDALLDELSYFS